MPFGQVKNAIRAGEECHSGRLRNAIRASLSKFCTSKVGTLKFVFAAEKAVKSQRSSTNFNCKVSFCRWGYSLLLMIILCVRSGRVKLKEIKH
jgi:hypothetical protein